MRQRKLTGLLYLSALAMFGFGFALVPLYDVFCQVTGINGKPSNEAAVMLEEQVDQQREIKVQFMTHVDPKMPWLFEPEVREVMVHPGEIKKVSFKAVNQKRQYVIGQAIPSITPGTAAVYFHKTECFCFNQQQLSPLASVDMPLIFYLDTSIPETIKTLTLSYTLYNVSDQLVASTMKNGVFNE
tara:strand:- start:6555 stop:7109 length:555 start_codon:yes stop_codon:yes gene_type:complete